jgi:transmembrane sensor
MTEMEQLLRENPEWIFPAEHLQKLFLVEPKDHPDYEAETAFELHLDHMRQKGMPLPETPALLPITSRPNSRKKGYLFFSLLVLILVATVIIRSTISTPKPALQKTISEVSTPIGAKSTKLVLPDSTVVWLNAGSRLTYNEKFGQDNRNTTLIGEAFFDVKKSNIPFIIHAHVLRIRVMGTAFNVKSYPNEKTTETSLIRGSLEITLDKRPGERFILRPNEKLVVSNDTSRTKQKPSGHNEPIVMISGLTQAMDSTVIETSWIDNKLAFQNESFDELATRMERWYGVEIDFRDQQVARERLSGTFTNETIQEALERLQLTTNFQFTIKANNITITQH